MRYHWMRQGSALAIGVLILAGIAAVMSINARAAGLDTAGSAATGMTIFDFECASCHGYAAEGTDAAPALVGDGAPADVLSTEDIGCRVAEGFGAMPAATLSDRDLADVAAYLREIQAFGGI
ncbi:MAG: cytochrome c [Actinobacteria bacterium]|nr:cytochrome c [Actinomycetota bacterium]